MAKLWWLYEAAPKARGRRIQDRPRMRRGPRFAGWRTAGRSPRAARAEAATSNLDLIPLHRDILRPVVLQAP
jgi:hypothetical protein